MISFFDFLFIFVGEKGNWEVVWIIEITLSAMHWAFIILVVFTVFGSVERNAGLFVSF